MKKNFNAYADEVKDAALKKYIQAKALQSPQDYQSEEDIHNNFDYSSLKKNLLKTLHDYVFATRLGNGNNLTGKYKLNEFWHSTLNLFSFRKNTGIEMLPHEIGITLTALQKYHLQFFLRGEKTLAINYFTAWNLIEQCKDFSSLQESIKSLEKLKNNLRSNTNIDNTVQHCISIAKQAIDSILSTMKKVSDTLTADSNYIDEIFNERIKTINKSCHDFIAQHKKTHDYVNFIIVKHNLDKFSLQHLTELKEKKLDAQTALEDVKLQQGLIPYHFYTFADAAQQTLFEYGECNRETIFSEFCQAKETLDECKDEYNTYHDLQHERDHLTKDWPKIEEETARIPYRFAEYLNAENALEFAKKWVPEEYKTFKQTIIKMLEAPITSNDLTSDSDSEFVDVPLDSDTRSVQCRR